MALIKDTLVIVHILFGSMALLLFWMPVLAKKGGRAHKAAGRYYATVMYVVCATAFVASLLVIANPLGVQRPGELLGLEDAAQLAGRYRMFAFFLLMLSVLVFVNLRHGVLALKSSRISAPLGQRSHRLMIGTLAGLALVVGWVGVEQKQVLLMAFAGVAISSSLRMHRDSRRETLTREQRLVAHFGGLIGSGIGAHTAFFAFGGARFLGDLLPGQWQVIPWVLPSVIGLAAISRLKRRYRHSSGASASVELENAG